MAESNRAVLRDVTEVLDGNVYNQCVFTNCKMVYRGGQIPLLRQCTFNDCSLHFEDAARRTLDLLKGMYQGFGPMGRKIVEDTFENIRRGGGW